MTQIFLFIQESWDTTVIATVALAVLTLALVYYTAMLAKEARITREQSVEPNIVVTIEPSNQAEFYAILIIENVGKGVAYNVQIKESVGHAFKGETSDFILNDLAFMNLKILKVHQKVEHLLGKFENLPSKMFEFNVSALDVNGKEIKCSNTVDVSCYYDRISFKNKNMDDLVSEIEKIEKNLGKVISGFSRLKVDSYTQENRNQERADREAFYQESQKRSQNEND